MNGMQHIHIPRDGHLLGKWLVVLLIAILLLSACSVGRGDWAIEIHSGYWIDRVNSKEILLVYKESPEQSNAAIAIPNYYITGYCAYDRYIVLEGIQTENLAASSEEIDNNNICFCIVFTESGDISDFYYSRPNLEEYCALLGIDLSDNWVYLS